MNRRLQESAVGEEAGGHQPRRREDGPGCLRSLPFLWSNVHAFSRVAVAVMQESALAEVLASANLSPEVRIVPAPSHACSAR